MKTAAASSDVALEIFSGLFDRQRDEARALNAALLNDSVACHQRAVGFLELLARGKVSEPSMIVRGSRATGLVLGYATWQKLLHVTVRNPKKYPGEALLACIVGLFQLKNERGRKHDADLVPDLDFVRLLTEAATSQDERFRYNPSAGWAENAWSVAIKDWLHDLKHPQVEVFKKRREAREEELEKILGGLVLGPLNPFGLLFGREVAGYVFHLQPVPKRILWARELYLGKITVVP